MEDFADGEEESMENLNVIYYVALVSIFIFGIMAAVKFQYARVLNSSSLRKDGICSALGTILAVSLFFNTSMTMASNGSLWWLDPLVAIVCGIGSMLYGLKAVYKAYVIEGAPIFNCSWWLYGGQKNVEEEEEGDYEMPAPATMTMTTTPTTTTNNNSIPVSPMSPPASSAPQVSNPTATTSVPVMKSVSNDDGMMHGNDGDIEDIALT
jgi:Predicted Co/Zn/Cd cation transporters